MNAGSPHLDVDQLVEAANDRVLDDPARAHLTVCPDCRAEAERWANVAAGLRLVVAATPLPPGLCRPPEPFRQPPAAHPVPSRRSTIVAVAAAAAVIAGGTAYGLTAARTGATSPRTKAPSHLPRTAAGLTAVRGCPGKYITAGTLEQVSGTQVIVQPANDTDHVNRTWRAHSVTVVTSGSTVVTRPVSGTVSDITDGSRVVVQGKWSGGRLAATQVGIEAALPSPGSLGPRVAIHPGHVRRLGPPRGMPGPPFANGTVTDVHSGSFTVVTDNPISGVERIRVITSKSTKVVARASVSLSQLRLGANVVAVGPIGRHGVLRASTLAQTSDVLIELAGGPVKIRPAGCSAAAITTAAVLAGR